MPFDSIRDLINWIVNVNQFSAEMTYWSLVFMETG